MSTPWSSLTIVFTTGMSSSSSELLLISVLQVLVCLVSHVIYHVSHKSLILLQSWPRESSICWHWQVEGCGWAGPHPATYCLRWQISLQPSFCACCQASHIWRLRSGRWSHLYGAAHTTGNSTRTQLCIEPLQTRSQNLNSLVRWYGNRIFFEQC